MKHPIKLRTIRRSVALPGTLVEELSALAPAELRGNWNRLVTVALREYAVRRRALAFESQMAAMAADPEVQAECAMIGKEFSVAGLDGLRHD
jgi:metal-responsive CopG/Arc/MetJ family transcriptional regulator